MPPRMNQNTFKSLAPAVYQAVNAFDEVAGRGVLDEILLELAKLRCSQLNGCAYCCQYHTRILLESGVSPDKISLVPAWAETDAFSVREKAAIGWAEELTLLADSHASDAAYAAVSAEFSESELAHLTAAIAAINVWNRLAVAFRYDPPYPVPAS
jgi:AhpD family alkylhydroperoxidase